MTFTVDTILVESNIVRFKYTYDRGLSKYFKNNNDFFIKFDEDVSNVPDSILVIPLLANILPISWFAGFDVKVKCVDKVFFQSIELIKQKFGEYYSDLPHSEVVIDQLEDNSRQKCKRKVAMLFSGGVDAYTTYLRHYEEVPDLITIKGADILLSDTIEWTQLKGYLDSQPILEINSKRFIESNIRDFYTFDVERLLPNLGWWGKVQHGLALTTLAAPLAYLHGYETLYISSSYTRKNDYPVIIWGSMPEIDNLIGWAGCLVKHDAEELTRQEKISYIVKKSKNLGITPELRVCYNEFKKDLNCSVCEKCQRTIYALMVSGTDPNKYGFEVDINIFDKLERTMKSPFMSDGNRQFWKEIYNETLINSSNYFMGDNVLWADRYKNLNAILQINIQKDIKKVSSWQKQKLALISKFPKTFKTYLIIRRKFL